ncbi:MAG TPA: glycosyltransferase, partial [Phormidium sp.]
DYYRAADIFTLASLREGFGRAIIEALGLGLPILVHDYDIPRELMADYGYYADFTTEDGLSSLLANVLNLPYDPEAAARRSRYAYQRYGWPNIMPDYVNLIRRVIALPE